MSDTDITTPSPTGTPPPPPVINEGDSSVEKAKPERSGPPLVGMRSFFSNKFLIVSVAVLLLGLVAGIILVQQRQLLRQYATHGGIRINKSLCTSLEGECVPDASLSGYLVGYIIYHGTDNTGNEAQKVAVTLNGSTGSKESTNLEVGTYTVCEVPLAGKESGEREDLFAKETCITTPVLLNVVTDINFVNARTQAAPAQPAEVPVGAEELASPTASPSASPTDAPVQNNQSTTPPPPPPPSNNPPPPPSAPTPTPSSGPNGKG